MEGWESQVIFMFITFHTFLIAVVRPFSFTFYKNLIEFFDKLLSEGKKEKEEIKEKFQPIDDYGYWKGGWMHFACNFWIVAILIGAVYTLQKFRPICNFFSFNSLLFCLISIYLILTIISIIVRWDFLSKKILFLISVIIFFYIFPSLLFSFREKLKMISNADLSTIYLIWVLSTFYLFFWHMIAAFIPPIKGMKDIIEQIRGIKEDDA